MKRSKKPWLKHRNSISDAEDMQLPAGTGAAPGRKKDTRRWCKGIVGREHVPVKKFWSYRGVEDSPPPGAQYVWPIIVCSVCGKRDWWKSDPITITPRRAD